MIEKGRRGRKVGWWKQRLGDTIGFPAKRGPHAKEWNIAHKVENTW